MTDALDEAAELVWHGATTPGQLDTGLLSAIQSVDEGERVQLAVLERFRKRGDTLAGWKVGLTSGQARDSFGPGVRPFGYLLQNRVFRAGDRIELKRIRRPGIETELCFRFGKRLAGAQVDAADARRAVRAVAPAFEINEDRLEGPATSGVRVADNLRQWGIVLGAEQLLGPDSVDLASIVAKMGPEGLKPERVAAKGHIDDHFQSLAALARELSKFGLALEPDAVAITGSFVRRSVDGPGRIIGSFSGLGEVSVEFF